MIIGNKKSNVNNKVTTIIIISPLKLYKTRNKKINQQKVERK